MESSLIPDLVAVLVTAGIAAWGCQKIGVSLILGYLVAGIVVGPYTPPNLVQSIENVHTLANLGLVFVMFFIGLDLSLQRLKTLGLAPILVTALTALFIFNGTRFLGGFLGFDHIQTLFIAATIMVSSSVIVNKIFTELDLSREPFARSAMGVTLLEDTVAVSMLAILGSLGVAAGGDGAPGDSGVVSLLGRLAGFVLLAVFLALLCVPKLLNKLSRCPNEVMTIVMGGILLLIAWLAASAGYSLALGAFLLGSVVGGTAHKARFLQVFEGLHDIFAAVFFVSMGMLFDVSLLPDALPLALGLVVAAIVGRSLAAFLAFLLAGKSPDFATRGALSLVPLGEFSFVIAQLGVSSGRMPETFFPACVGAVLITTILSPSLTKLGCRLGPALERHEPNFIRVWQSFLERIAGAFQQEEGRSERFRGKGLLRRFVQLGLEASLVLSALVFADPIARGVLHMVNAFAEPLEAWIQGSFGRQIEAMPVFEILLGVLACLALLVPTIAIWRSLGQIGRILAEGLSNGSSAGMRFLQQAIEKATQAAGMFVFVLLCSACAPNHLPATGKSLLFVALILLMALLLRAPISRWHVRVQEGLREQVEGNGGSPEAGGEEGAPSDLALAREAFSSAEWSLHVREHRLGSLSRAVGMTVMETDLRRQFGCSIVAIERHGIVLSSPGAGAMLFPDDLLLLVGTDEQLDRAEEWLGEMDATPDPDELPFSELTTESLTVPAAFANEGKTLAELEVSSRFRVMVLGVERKGEVIQNPSGEQSLSAGDRLLVLGFPKQNRAFRKWFEQELTLPPTPAG